MNGLLTMRSAVLVASLLLCGSVLTGCASENAGAQANIGQHKDVSAGQTGAALPTDVDSGVRQAQLARLAGHYDEAIHTLSQLMLVAADDPRVVGEYGKTLVEKGRAQEAVQFLTRATELQPKDWTLYSALGVAHDESGDQNSARQAYMHALALKPDEPSVLNNYALSRMLAGDPAMARELIASAAKAGGASDPKIARNIALVNSLAPAQTPMSMAQVPAAKAPAEVASRAPATAPTPITSAALPAGPAAIAKTNPQVVMEPVPVDPLAGPVKPHAKTAAKPANPDDKAEKPADAKAAASKSAIPELRQASLNY